MSTIPITWDGELVLCMGMGTNGTTVTELWNIPFRRRISAQRLFAWPWGPWDIRSDRDPRRTTLPSGTWWPVKLSPREATKASPISDSHPPSTLMMTGQLFSAIFSTGAKFWSDSTTSLRPPSHCPLFLFLGRSLWPELHERQTKLSFSKLVALRVLGYSAVILSDSGFLQKVAHARPLAFCLFLKTTRDPKKLAWYPILRRKEATCRKWAIYRGYSYLLILLLLPTSRSPDIDNVLAIKSQVADFLSTCSAFVTECPNTCADVCAVLSCCC
jgi:hypothetical protein